MRIVWIIILVLLLLGQFITYLKTGKPLPGTTTPAEGHFQGFEKLVSETRVAWKDALEAIPPDHPEPRENGEDRLLRREHLMLELRDREEALTRTGAEIKISSGLTAWFAAASRYSLSPGGGLDWMGYLTGLDGWLTILAGAGGEVAVERSFLIPGHSTGPPVLSFELRGSVPAIGSILLDYQSRFPEWQLDELDLVKEQPGEQPWVRGTFTFLGAGV